MINIIVRIISDFLLRRAPLFVKRIVLAAVLILIALVVYSSLAREPRENKAICTDVDIITTNNGKVIDKVVLTFENKAWILFGSDSFSYSLSHKDYFQTYGWLKSNDDERPIVTSKELPILSKEIEQQFINKSYGDMQDNFKKLKGI